MFDRFTDRARKVMGLSRQAAQRWSHDYIGTEHILCGLVEGDVGVGAAALENLGIDLGKIRRAIEELVLKGTIMVTAGQLPFTPHAKQVLEFSLKESEALGHTYIGTEHLLLGLIRVQEGIAARVLEKLGVTVEAVRREVQELLGSEPGDVPDTAQRPPGPMKLLGVVQDTLRADPPSTLPFLRGSASCRKLWESAVEEAQRLGKTLVQPEHVLLAMLRDDKGMAASLLAEVGVKVGAVRAEIERIFGAAPPAGGASPTP